MTLKLLHLLKTVKMQFVAQHGSPATQLLTCHLFAMVADFLAL